ncbi:hypothetical protein [Nitrosopumilus spindle-shaped virus]|uniref:Uncharacterized protein n=1 Tax=Nitrosopumilus spindle-shaped virus TaxID=2508184 RepID=A0A514K353_9VIRU|nr:hypothetical protein [Nitrosopumilus spindle-shaped virus]
MALSKKQKTALVMFGVVTATVVTVLMVKNGKFGTTAKEGIDKLDSKVNSIGTSQTKEVKSSLGDKVTEKSKTVISDETSPIFSSSRTEGENIDPLQNLTTYQISDDELNIDASLGDPLF